MWVIVMISPVFEMPSCPNMVSCAHTILMTINSILVHSTLGGVRALFQFDGPFCFNHVNRESRQGSSDRLHHFWVDLNFFKDFSVQDVNTTPGVYHNTLKVDSFHVHCDYQRIRMDFSLRDICISKVDQVILLFLLGWLGLYDFHNMVHCSSHSFLVHGRWICEERLI